MNISNWINKKDKRDFDMFLERQKEKTMKETALLYFFRIKKDVKTLNVPRLRIVEDFSCAH